MEMQVDVILKSCINKHILYSLIQYVMKALVLQL
jgi:hypothetical protein